MAVAWCNRCGRSISISIIPGGNPVALADPEKWSATWRPCPVCHHAYCDRCMDFEPLCPKCPGPPKPPSKAFLLERIPWVCRNQGKCVEDIVHSLWVLTRDLPDVVSRVAYIRKSFSPETIRLISERAARELESFDKDESIWWGARCFSDDPEPIPRMFWHALVSLAVEDAS